MYITRLKNSLRIYLPLDLQETYYANKFDIYKLINKSESSNYKNFS